MDILDIISYVFLYHKFVCLANSEGTFVSTEIDPLNKRYLEKRNKYAWWVIFIYFYSMIDAMVDAHLSPFDQVMNTIIEDTKGESNE